MIHAPIQPRPDRAHEAAPQLAELLPLFAEYMKDTAREHLVVGGFDRHGRLRRFAEICGNRMEIASAIPPVRSVLAENAVTELVIAHNHPGQSAIPSVHDRQTTDRIAALARLAGAMLVDHLVFGDDGVFSISANRHIAGSAACI